MFPRTPLNNPKKGSVHFKHVLPSKRLESQTYPSISILTYIFPEFELYSCTCDSRTREYKSRYVYTHNRPSLLIHRNFRNFWWSSKTKRILGNTSDSRSSESYHGKRTLNRTLGWPLCERRPAGSLAWQVSRNCGPPGAQHHMVCRWITYCGEYFLWNAMVCGSDGRVQIWEADVCGFLKCRLVFVLSERT